MSPQDLVDSAGHCDCLVWVKSSDRAVQVPASRHSVASIHGFSMVLFDHACSSALARCGRATIHRVAGIKIIYWLRLRCYLM